MLSLLLTTLLAPAPLQDPTPTPVETPSPAPSEDPAASSVPAATVDGFAITEQAIEERFQMRLAERSGGRPLPPEQVAEVRDAWHDGLVEELIDERLLADAAVKAEVTVGSAEAREYLDRSLGAQLLMNSMTREELGERIQAAEGITLDEYLERESKDPLLLASLLQSKLVQARFPERAKVTEEELTARYEADKDASFTKPEMVRASHILIQNEGLVTEEDFAKARAEAEAIVALARAEGADFASLARERSQGPSAPDGGDLGFFPREGTMVEPFAAAAFALETGAVSDVVETEFGYHVIKVTERKEPFVVPFETAKPWIRDALTFQRVGPLREELVSTLRAAATIEYASPG